MQSNLSFALVLTMAAILLPRDAVADQAWKTSNAIWGVRDKCTRQAQAAYPDYTPESNAKREKLLQTCLRGANLPTDGSSVPPQAPAPATPQQ